MEFLPSANIFEHSMQLVVAGVWKYDSVAVLTVVRTHNDCLGFRRLDLEIQEYLIVDVVVRFLPKSLVDTVEYNFFIFEGLQQEFNFIVFFEVSEYYDLKVKV